MFPSCARRSSPRDHRSGIWWRGLACLLLLAATGVGCAAHPPATPRSGPGPTAPVATPAFAAYRWVIVDTPTRSIAFDRSRSALLILPPREPAPRDTVVRGASDLGRVAAGLWLHEELLAAEGPFTAAEAPFGAGPRVVATTEREETRLLIEGIMLGDVGVARWEVRLRGQALTLHRTVTLRRAARDPEAVLVLAPLTGAAARRLLLLDGVAFPATDRPGGIARAVAGRQRRGARPRPGRLAGHGPQRRGHNRGGLRHGGGRAADAGPAPGLGVRERRGERDDPVSSGRRHTCKGRGPTSTPGSMRDSWRPATTAISSPARAAGRCYARA